MPDLIPGSSPAVSAGAAADAFPEPASGGPESSAPVLASPRATDREPGDAGTGSVGGRSADGDAPAGSVRSSVFRRSLQVLLASLVFEVLYLAVIALIALLTGGVAAVAPTMQSVVATPFMWVPVAAFAVYLEVFALWLNRGPRWLIGGSLAVGIAVYLTATLVILLLLGGAAALHAFGGELTAYPFFLAGIAAREVVVWSNIGRRFPHPACTQRDA